jgi:isopenicillin N synthase-like dioxygenase
MAKQNNMTCAVVFRVGYEEQQISRSVKKSGIIYIPLSEERTKLTDVSSTQIRQYFQSPTASNTNVEKNIYPNVREYMSRKYRKK